VLIYDSFAAIKQHVEASSNGKEDVSEVIFQVFPLYAQPHVIQVVMTASTLYEAAEPQLVWRKLLHAVFDDITGDGETFKVIGAVPNLPDISLI